MNSPILLPNGHRLLNFHQAPMYISVPFFGVTGIRVRTVEHYFQAMKAFYLMPPHQENQEKLFMNIASSDTPMGSKRLGRSLPINVPIWNGARTGHMLEGMIAKFHQHSALREELLATDGLELREHSRDRVWGDGIDGKGLNLAGLCLMQARELFINSPE